MQYPITQLFQERERVLLTMEMKLMGWSMIVIGLVVMVLNHACPAYGVTCPEALLTLMPCEPYLVGPGLGTPAVPCCTGIKNLVSLATTTEIRRNLCECFKRAVARFQINPDRLKQLPQFCKVSLLVPLDPKMDCSK